jgi:hypothetical protein
MFTDKEIEYLNGQRLGRLATVTAGGWAHAVPTGFRLSEDQTAIEVTMSAHRDPLCSVSHTAHSPRGGSVRVTNGSGCRASGTEFASLPTW